MRLVIADDHNLFREALCYYLRQSSLAPEIIEASSLGEALDRVAATRPDALLLDFVMPGMEGVQGVEVARQSHPDVPVVVLSGNMTREQMTEALRRGAAGVISKDLTGKALVEALERILSGESVVAPPVWVEPLSPQAEREEGWKHFKLTQREVEVVEVHHLGPCRHEVFHELFLRPGRVRHSLRSQRQGPAAAPQGRRADAQVA